MVSRSRVMASPVIHGEDDPHEPGNDVVTGQGFWIEVAVDA